MYEYEKPFAEVIELLPSEAIMNDFEDGWLSGEGEEDW